MNLADNSMPVPPAPVPGSTPIRRRSDRTGVLGLLMTLGLKFTKLATIVKGVFLAASFGTYAVLFSWQFAVLILVSLFVHENGHIWAMKRLGMRTKGIYFIPLLGGAAVADEAFPSRRGEVFVAIMGPIWGLALAAIVAGLYAVTGESLWAAAAGWMAFINLFNLFPVNPLDGGRIVKSIAFSLNGWLGLIAMAAGFIGALAFSIWLGFGLLVFIVFIGGWEFLAEYRARRRGIMGLAPMRLGEIAASGVAYAALAAVLLGLMLLMQEQPDAGLTVQFLQS